ncbi:MAG: NAD-dependent epimerase/dehydratase family protein [Candidatus Aenigmarchaeota archaeon]|nr:NAD-dependent epimerase/dehydratase family protein [Candidatus Aenigmarchaeota archaeon]
MKILVTGGLGFIGSWLMDSFLKNNDITIIDKSSYKGKLENKNVNFIKQDLSKECIFDKQDIVYHFAAFPDVRLSANDIRKVFDNNILATINVLEACRKSDIKKILFASTSTVYGLKKGSISETSELNPISNYGASKIAGENYIQMYSRLYGIQYVIIRYANIFGPRSDHGVVWDLYHKLKKNPKELLILGNGLQNKSYLYITDTIDATFLAAKQTNDIYNIGSDYQITVDSIAKIIIDEMGLENVTLKHTSSGKVAKGGWKGDVPSFLLDINKIKKLGWKPQTKTEEGIRKYVRWMVENKL